MLQLWSTHWKIKFHDSRWRPFWIFASQKLCPHFWEGHPLSFYYLYPKDHKTAEKPSFPLNGHGFTPNDPTILGSAHFLLKEICCNTFNWCSACGKKPSRLIIDWWKRWKVFWNKFGWPFHMLLKANGNPRMTAALVFCLFKIFLVKNTIKLLSSHWSSVSSTLDLSQTSL